eukprot:Plantae.Rhodophyta-Palmaria_palmata.ctg15045.p1 GENE.Plantae.Rhodophyta-Palmaria_palmata.ctg15045~~Plantae.Rhodophyta-Palmaria_palmata.ctg15045.p1  ORF type:complete len:228 (+),score=5.56 Plantae.Rhodophyta-Palmaria_palmata.ctg15045:463-1146(+)
MQRLRAFHLDAPEPSKRLPRDKLPDVPTLSKTQLRKTAKKVYETSAVALDGMNVNHFRLLLRDSPHDQKAQAGEYIFLAHLQTAADGRFFPRVAELYASSRLIAIEKPPKPDKSPGIGTIAIGTVFRRVVATMVFKKASAEASAYLLPEQVSFALAAGTEVLIHSFPDVLSAQGNDQGKILFRVDSRSALNAILRAAFLRLVILHASVDTQLFYALYVSHPFLTVGD